MQAHWRPGSGYDGDFRRVFGMWAANVARDVICWVKYCVSTDRKSKYITDVASFP